MEKDVEKQITESIAKIASFSLSTKTATCNKCGKQYRITSYGQGLNERMLGHHERHGMGLRKTR